MCQYLVENPDTYRVDIVCTLELLRVLHVDLSRKFKSYDVVAGVAYLHNKGVVHADPN